MTELIKVSGVGPKAVDRLGEAGIYTAEELAAATQEQLVEAGFGAKMAKKIKTAAELLVENEQAGEVTLEKAKKTAKKSIKKASKKTTKKTKKVEETKPKKKSPRKKEREDQRSPQALVANRKKKGIQIRSVVDDEKELKKVDRGEIGWQVTAKTLSEEEREEKRKRLEAMNRAATITRPIPSKPEPVKAKGSKRGKSEKPLKQIKEKKKQKLKKKKVKKAIEYFSQDDLIQPRPASKKRGISAKSSGETKPRINLERDTYLGMTSSHRRSRRVKHTQQLIVDLEIDGVTSDQLVGQKVYFKYPDTEVKVPGSISKRFGKASSRKVLANFKKGIRQEGLHQKLFIK